MRGARVLAFAPVFALIVISACSSEPPTGGTNQGPTTNGSGGANAPPLERSRVADLPQQGPHVAPESPLAAATSTQATTRIPVLSRTGLMPGEIPFDDGTSGLTVDSAACGGANLVYRGGPVMMNPTIY